MVGAIMSSTILLSVLLFHSVWGTFPPVSNPPPIPSRSVRGKLDIQSQGGQLFISEDLPQAPPTVVKDEIQFSPEAKPDEQRWYLQESQSSEIPSSIEGFDRFYPNGEPAIGPVATPIPDDAYIAQSSRISSVNPNDPTNAGPSDIWIVTRGSGNQYMSEKWIPIQLPTQQVVEVANQDPNPQAATDTVKSISAPLPPDASIKTQLISGPPANILQQIWVRAPPVVGSQNVITDPATIVQNIQSVKQIVDFPAPSVKQVVQQQITKDAIPVPPPPVAPVVSKKTFTVPPPPPPPLKGFDKTTTVVSAAPIPDSNILITDKSGPMQQVRHIWIPTSARTGRFITVPVSSVNVDKSVVNKGVPVNPTPISVSDTWVLKQNGPDPSFEQQKSLVPPPVVQSGKVFVPNTPVLQTGKVFVQNPPVLQIDTLTNPPIMAQTDVSSFPPVVEKTSGPPLDIWPARQDGTNAKVLTKSPVVPAPDISLPPPKSGTVIASKSFPVPPPVAPVVSPKSVVVNSKVIPPPPVPVVPVLNGKPCPLPLPLPKSPVTSTIPSSYTVPRFTITRRQPQPLTRIIRVNRYPTGSYYLLNTGIRPNFYTYPTSLIVQQPKSGLVRVIQTQQLPIPVQSKQPIPPVSVPVQPKLIAPQVLLRKLPFTLPARKILLPISSQKSPTRILYPSVQPLRYAYPLKGYLKAGPIPGKRVLSPLINTLRLASPVTNSASSSSESSSESDSSESSGEKKKEEKAEKAETSESEAKSKEVEKESEAKSDEKEKEGEEASAESQSKESIEAAESQISPQAAQNAAYLPTDDSLKAESKPYIFGFDLRDKNGTLQHRQEVSDVEGRVTGSYGYQDPDGVYRIANYVADSEGFRVNVESNEPGTVTHESAYANFISNKVTDNEKFQTEDSTGTIVNTEQRD